MFVFLVIVLILVSTPSFACQASDEVKHKQFKESDTNHDGKLSYEEHFDYEKHKLDVLDNNRPGFVSRILGLGDGRPDHHFEIDERYFKIHWHAADTNKDGYWSEEEYMHQITNTRC